MSLSTAKKLKIDEQLTHAESIIATPAMISPFWDLMMTGGLSSIVFIWMSISFPRNSPDNAVAAFVFNLSFAVNFPHFMASYQILYGDFRKKIFSNYRYIIAGVVVPIVLAVGMTEAFVASNPMVFGYFLVAMYFFVGWHYVKQTFGVMIVSNAYKKIYYNKQERFWLLMNLYAIWAVSFFNSNQYAISYSQFGISYPSLNLTAYPLQISYGVLALGIVGTVWMHVQKYIREGAVPPASAFMAYAAIYSFLLPLVTHPMYAHTAPFFHSLQYLLFVYTYQRNKVESEVAELPAIQGRRHRVYSMASFFGAAVILGALSFVIVPGFFDQTTMLNRGLFGPTPFVLFATLFINIHHYFIDNVIWKGNNPEIREHLFPAK